MPKNLENGRVDRRLALGALLGGGLSAACSSDGKSAESEDTPKDGRKTFAQSGIVGVTRGPADLVVPPDGEQYRYGLGYAFQVDAQKAGLFCNLRTEGLPVGDFEAGMDVVVFGRVDEISSAEPMPITRNEKYKDQASSIPRLIIKHDQKGGFIPGGAKRGDGSSHPHAGTGFLIGAALDFPMKPDGSYDKVDKVRDMARNVEMHNLLWDGAKMQIVKSELRSVANPLIPPGSEWKVFGPGMRMAIPDGDDLIMGVEATKGDVSAWRSEPSAAGVSRWRRTDRGWQIVDFAPVAFNEKAETPVVAHGQEMSLVRIEPTLIRDTDGALLFSARSAYSDFENHVIRIWRSKDGMKWDLIIEIPDGRGQAPVTLNQAVDGTPYLVMSAFGRERDLLILRALNKNRDGLEEAITARNAIEDFGPPPVGPVWFVDHSNATTVRLSDGEWHNLLVYRVMDRGEHSGKPPAPQTGLYVEEVHSSGKPLPRWKF